MPQIRFPRRPFLTTVGVVALVGLSAAPLAAQEDDFTDLAGAYLAARAADFAGDYPQVISYGMLALARDSSNTGLMEGMIMARLGMGQIDEGVPVARRLIALEPESQIAGLILLADAMGKENWDEVETLITGPLQIGDLMEGMISAWTAIGQGRMSAAIETFDALAKVPGNTGPALLQKALALALVGDFEGSAVIFGGDETVLQLNRPGIIAYIQVLSQLERNPDAVQLIDQAFPGTTDSELVTLRAELEAGKPIPFDTVKNPKDGLSALFLQVGSGLLGETDPGLVLLYARLSEYLATGNIGAKLLIAQVFDEMEQWQMAADAYAEIPTTERAWPQAQLGRASALRRLGDVEGGIAVLQGLVDARPDMALAHSALGDALRFDQRYAEAIPQYDAAIEIYGEVAPSEWAVYFARGVSHERTGDWPAAEADFRAALELQPDQPSVLNYLGYSLVEKRQNLDEALGMIERAVAARPYDGYIRDSLGWVFFRLGRYDEAVEEMERAVELVSTDPVLNDHLGDTYWAVGREREARFEWSRALSFITDESNLDEVKPDRIRRKLEVGLDKVLEEEGAEPLQK